MTAYPVSFGLEANRAGLVFKFTMNKTKYIFIIGLIISMFGIVTGKIWAINEAAEASVAAEASTSATVTPVRENITEPQSQPSKDRLQVALEGQNISARHWALAGRAIRWAIARGVSANTVVLLLMLPLVASLVALLHYLFGITGYGIFTPAMVAVAFLATGVTGGLALFATILVITALATVMLRKVRLHFWPRRSLVLLAVCLGTGVAMAVSSYFGFLSLANISIFPVLILILVTEEFVRTQLVKSKNQAKTLAIGTLIMAILGASLMSWQRLQVLVILYPEGILLATILLNMLTGRYHGMRLSEIKKFRSGLR